MKYTTHYNLNKPEGPDLFNVEHFNENSTTIDNALFGLSQDITPMSAHISNQNNPHNVTKAQVGLGNVDNTSDLNKPVSTAVQTELNKKVNTASLATVATSGSYNDLISRPTLGTAAAKDVAASGDASSTEVVMGNDSRLTDSRPASDVYSWAKAATKPSYTASEVGAYTTTEVDNLISGLETGLDWKEAVATYSDIATTYPNPVDGWTVNVKDTDYTYRYDGTNWIVISANAIPNATTSVNGLMTTTQVTKLDGIASGAEVNQNSFSNILVGSTTIAADTKTDTVEFVAGSNITLTPDATNDRITIASTGGMDPAVYDPNGDVATAGGIVDYVEDVIGGSNDYVTPQMYGAYGDGVHDDTTAVNAALNSGNPRVHFPTGEYLVQWLNSITLTNRALFISGAGKYESIIHFADARESSGDGYGYKFATGTSGTSSIFIRDIGLYHDNQDTEVTYTAVNYNLLTFNGQFKTIDVDNVYIHTGYNRTTGCATPYNTCIWGKAGADEIRVTNTVFENFDNREKGGGLWWSPSDWSRIFTCGHVEFSGNTFRHTNNDEAIAFWALGDENDPNVFRDDEFNMREVKMVNNLIIHDDFNGECYRTDYLINFAARSWNENLAANYFFSGNKIILNRSRLGVFRTENLDEVVYSNNDIYVGSVTMYNENDPEETTNIHWQLVSPIAGRVIFKHNMFNCTAPANFDRVNIPTYKATVEVVENVFKSSQWFVLASWNPGSVYVCPDSAQGVGINFIGNTVENKSIGVDAGNNTKFNVIDNKFNGNITFVGQSSGSPINIRGNTFRYRYGDVSDRDLRGRDVKYIDNHGVRLTVDSAQITSAMDNFVYVGRKEDLIFKVNGSVVDDSVAVRARFFTACDITYYGGDGGSSSSTLLTQTLAANATDVTFTGVPTTGTNVIDFYSEGGANYTAINTSTPGEITLTYDAVSSARTICCEIREV